MKRYDRYSHLYKAIDFGARFIKILEKSEINIESMDDGINNYTKYWHLIDQLYRKCIFHTRKFDQTQTLHARHIITDHGRKILLGRGLDIFQHYEMNDSFSLNNRLQQYRSCKAFEITYLKVDD